jgi:hypothetical protein
MDIGGTREELAASGHLRGTAFRCRDDHADIMGSWHIEIKEDLTDPDVAPPPGPSVRLLPGRGRPTCQNCRAT